MSIDYEIGQKKTPGDIGRFIQSTVPSRTHNSLDVCEPSKSWLIMGFVPGGYRLHFVQNEHVGVRILVGCRNFTYEEARTHWGNVPGKDAERHKRAVYLYNVLPWMKQMLEADDWNFDWKPAPKTKTIQFWKLEYLCKTGNGWGPRVEIHRTEQHGQSALKYCTDYVGSYRDAKLTGPHNYEVPID